MKLNFLNRLLFTHLIAAVCVTSTAYAADTIWISNLNADWGTAANWNDGLIGTNDVPNTSTERAVFNGTGTQNNVTFTTGASSAFGGVLVTAGQTSALTINNSSGSSQNFRLISGAGITIEADAGAFSLGTSGGVIQLVPDTPTPATTFQNDSSNTATLGSKITSVTGGGNNAWTLTFTGAGDWQVDAALNSTPSSGASSIIKNGLGTTTLSAANTFSGTTTVNAGTLKLANNLALQNSTLDTSGAGVVDITGFTTPTFGGLTGGTNLASVITGYSGVTSLALNPAAGSRTYSGSISDGVAGMTLTKTGAGTQILSGANTYTGATTITAGTLSVGTSANLGDAASNLVFDGGTLQITGTSLTNFSGIGHAVSFNATKTVGLDINDAAHTFTLDQALNQTTGGFTKLGAGKVILNQVNTYTGNTVITAGTLEFSTAADQTLTGAISGAGALTKSGTGKLTLTATNTYTGTTTINGGTLEFSAAANQNLTGALSGSGALIKSGAGQQLNFSGDISGFTGTMTLTTGLSVFGTSNSGSAGATFVTGSGGAGEIVLAPSTRTVHFGALSGGGNLRGQSVAGGGIMTASIGALNTDTTYSGGISQHTNSPTNTVAVTKVGTGTLTLSGTANTYTGVTTIDGGILEVAKLANGGASSSIGQAAVAATNLVLNGGALKFTGTTGNGSTNRLFTIGVNGAMIDGSSSDNTALTFTGTGSLATTAGATDRTLTLTGTTSAGTQNSITSTIIDPTGGGKTAVTKSGGNTWVLNGANSYTGSTTVQQGTLTLGASGTISSALVLGVGVGTTGTLDVTAKALFTQANVSGNGTLNIGSGKTINVTSALAPGFSPGTLNVTGNLALAGATTTMELAGNLGVAGTDYDFVDVSGDFTLDGILNIISYGGYDLAQVGTYNLFDATTFAGDFDSVNVGGLGLALANDVWSADSGNYNYSFDQGSGVLTVIPEPRTALLGGLGVLVLLRRRRG